MDKETEAYVAYNPLYGVSTWKIVPPGFSTDAAQAVAAAKATRSMQAIHRREHPLRIFASVWVEKPQHWQLDFTYRDRRVAEVDVSPRGRVIAVWTGPQVVAPYARGHYAPLFDSWWIVVPFSAAFLLPFLDPRRWRRMVHLDALALLSFIGSYALFDHLQLEAAVWAVYPPMLYLVARLWWIGNRGAAETRGLSPLLPIWMLAGGLAALTAARVTLGIVGHQVIDVSWASVGGAQHILSGQPLYSHGNAHGDTYGPFMYLTYVPFLLLLPWHGLLGFVPAAKAASITFDVLTIAALVALGWRLRGGRRGVRLGLALAWVWAACPFTLLALMARTNDALVALLSVLSLLAFSSRPARGALLGLAAAAKFSPGGLLPLYAGGRGDSVRGRLACIVPAAAVFVGLVMVFLPAGGVSEFYQRTIGYQLTRGDVFSPWALHPGLAPLKVPLELLAAGLVIAPAFFRRRRSLVEVCALAGAITIALQLPAVHWFYFYILWFLPFIAVALLGGGREHGAVVPAVEVREQDREPAMPEPALVGA